LEPVALPGFSGPKDLAMAMVQSERDDEGVRRLWSAVFGREPPPGAPRSALLDEVIRATPVAGYAVLRRFGTVSPHEPGRVTPGL
jgi:hypothetical protein